MKQTITKNDKNINILNHLIVNGFYSGYIETERFELIPNRFPNNHRIIGILNNEGNYDLKFDLKSPMEIMAKILLGFGTLISIIFLIKGIWIVPIALIISGFIILIDFKAKEKKEINILRNKLLEFHKSEYD